MALHASFRSGSIFEACDDLLQTGTRILSRGETRSCGSDSADVCSRVGVRQFLEDAVPVSGCCLGLRNVTFLREGSVYIDS